LIKERIARACLRTHRSPAEIRLIAVTKTVEPEMIKQAFQLGIREFGESRLQEGERKKDCFFSLDPRPILHMIGHLQSNKVKPVLSLFDLIHSVDSIKLAEIINRQTTSSIPILLEVNVSAEVSKSGFTLQEIEPSLTAISKMARLKVAGLMTVAPIEANPEQVRPIFRQLRELKEKFSLQHLSMGMSDDFEIAIEEGATMIRLGRALFGERIHAINPV
jgi:PLP dependent protein